MHDPTMMVDESLIDFPSHFVLWPSDYLSIRKLSIIIPCYNEASTIARVLNNVLSVKLIKNIEKEVIIINDCSKDETDLVIEKYMTANKHESVTYLRHNENRGKGGSIHTGIAAATGDFVLIQDADLEYDPAEYNILLGPVLKAQADVVYGSRFIGGNPHRILFFWHTFGNRVLTLLSNIFSNLNLTDMETGYKLFRTDLIKAIPLKEKRFGFEPEITQKIARVKGIKIYEVGISYYGRTYQEGKKIGIKDAIRCLICLVKYSLLWHSVKIATINKPTSVQAKSKV